MKNRLRQALSNEDGSALIDAMLGVIVTAIAITGLVTISTSTANAVYSTAVYEQRTSFLRSQVNTLAGDVADVPTTPVTETVRILGDPVKVTTWREEKDATTSIIHAATAGTRDQDGSNCVDPAHLDPHCTVTEVPVPRHGHAGIQTVPAAVTWTSPEVSTAAGADLPAGPVGSFTRPGATTEMRYVVRVSAPGPAEIRFMSGATVLDSVWVDETTAGYLYGSLPAAAATDVSIALTGTAHLSQFYVYEAPK